MPYRFAHPLPGGAPEASAERQERGFEWRTFHTLCTRSAGPLEFAVISRTTRRRELALPL